MGRRATYSRETIPVKKEQASLFEDEQLFEEPILEKEAPVKKEKKEFKETDKIPCVSITVGGLYWEGPKSKELYSWLNMGDVVEVEYRDLVSAIRSNSVYIFEPLFIIQDDDFLAQFDNVQVRYGQLYTPADIEAVLRMAPAQLDAALRKMPVGAQNALRDTAVRKIDSGELDSVQRIKIIDSFFGTELVLKLTQ